jgi:hypothetical protein
VLNFDAGTRFSAIDSTKRAFDRNRRGNWVCFVIPPGSNACASRSGVMMKVDHPDATLTEAAGVRDLPRIDALAPVKCAETFLSASRACFEPIQYFGTKISNVHGIASYC